MTDRKKPGVAFWATVFFVGLMLYALTFGPVCSLVGRNHLPDWAADILWAIYRPMIWLMHGGPEPIRGAIEWYAALWLPPSQLHTPPDYLGEENSLM